MIHGNGVWAKSETFVYLAQEGAPDRITAMYHLHTEMKGKVSGLSPTTQSELVPHSTE
jgi:hypothetical protein